MAVVPEAGGVRAVGAAELPVRAGMLGAGLGMSSGRPCVVKCVLFARLEPAVRGTAGSVMLQSAVPGRGGTELHTARRCSAAALSH